MTTAQKDKIARRKLSPLITVPVHSIIAAGGTRSGVTVTSSFQAEKTQL